MNEAAKAATIAWISGQRSANRRIVVNAPHHHAGYRVGLMQAVFLIEAQIRGTAEEWSGGGDTIADHLARLKAELREAPTETAVRLGQEHELAALTARATEMAQLAA